MNRADPTARETNKGVCLVDQIDQRWVDFGGEANRRCFGCGSDNPLGLGLKFRQVNDGARAEFQPRPEYQGWDNMLHGGILLTMLDETLAYAALFAVGPAVTAQITARFRRPAPMDRRYVLSGRVTRHRLGMIEAHATIADDDGRGYAEADAKFMAIRTSG